MMKTWTIELVNFEQLPVGQNAMVAVMNYSRFDMEKSIVLKQTLVDRDKKQFPLKFLFGIWRSQT